VYIDGFLIASEDERQHHEHLRTLFERLNKYGVVINSAKCIFGISTITFLEYTVNTNDRKALAERVEAIVNASKPANAKELRRYLRMINFYRRFVPRVAKTLQPLNDLLKGVKKNNALIVWSEQTENSFRESKRARANATMLAHSSSL
jgi:hypothetical protein